MKNLSVMGISHDPDIYKVFLGRGYQIKYSEG